MFKLCNNSLLHLALYHLSNFMGEYSVKKCLTFCEPCCLRINRLGLTPQTPLQTVLPPLQKGGLQTRQVVGAKFAKLRFSLTRKTFARCLAPPPSQKSSIFGRPTKPRRQCRQSLYQNYKAHNCTYESLGHILNPQTPSAYDKVFSNNLINTL